MYKNKKYINNKNIGKPMFLLLIFVIIACSSCSRGVVDSPNPDPVPTTINSVITFDQPGQLIDVFFMT